MEIKEVHSTDQVKQSYLCETFELVTKNLYPNIYCILKILITTPPATATAEISLSVLKRVKTYLHATMRQERLSALTLIHIHIEIQLPLDAGVDKFNNTRQRKCFWLDCV